jgi:hypothetical protein
VMQCKNIARDFTNAESVTHAGPVVCRVIFIPYYVQIKLMQALMGKPKHIPFISHYVHIKHIIYYKKINSSYEGVFKDETVRMR